MSIRTRKHKDGKVTYQVVLERGFDSSGKRLRDYHSFPTKKEAQRFLTEKQHEMNTNTYIEPSKLTVEQALDEWFATSVEPKLKPNTQRGYLVNIAHINKHLGRQKQWDDRKALCGVYKENNLVCCTSNGEYRNCSTFTVKFSNLLKKVGMRHIRYHDLRHTNATLMMQYNVPIKVMSENLGHANTGVTMDTYSHVTMEMKTITADKFDEELFAKIG